MHEKVLPKHSLDLLNKLGQISAPELRGWTLAGGTGLAFHLGHRISEDLDFFRTDPFDVRDLHGVLAECDRYETLQESDHTLTVILRQTKLSFFRMRDPFLFDAVPFRFFAIADIRDIALMKIAAIVSRGSRRDFIDLYMILREKPTLRQLLDWMPRKYGASRVNAYHILKSLTFFDDAEEEPMPRMRIPFVWKECKAFFVRQAHAIVLP